jgi:hypothetical protein
MILWLQKQDVWIADQRSVDSIILWIAVLVRRYWTPNARSVEEHFTVR